MMTQQNFKDLNQQLLDLNFHGESAKTTKSKSFRSKMFQKNIVKPIPKINDKQIQLHNPRYQKYLQSDLKLMRDLEIPQIWGCIIPQPRKIQSPKKNYLKRNIDTSKNLFRTYVNRKNRLIYGVPLIKKVHSQQKSVYYEQLNPQQQRDQYFEGQVSQFFTEIKPVSKINSQNQRERFNQTARQKIKRYSDQEPQKFKSSQFFTTKPGSSSCTTRFSQILPRDVSKQKNKQAKRIADNKSLYKMSIDQLRESINWKRKFLKCLNQSINDAKRAPFI